MKKAQCTIALGSNLGDSLNIVENAVQILAQTPGMKLISCSNWYRTAPIGPPQPDYINGCALFQVQLTPLEILERLLAIENQFGRERREHWGARTLDLDLLLYDDLVLNTPHLQLPHPRMHERAFVLVPLAEIAPNWVHPVLKSNIQQILHNVDCSGVKRL